MRAVKGILFAAAFLSPWSFAEAPDALPAVDALFEKWDSLDSPGASVAIALEGKQIYATGYGSADLEQSTPIIADTIFHVASVSKQFTAFAILLLEAEGKLSIEDEIQRHLPELADFGVPVRIRHLIHHTSGFRGAYVNPVKGAQVSVVTRRNQLRLVLPGAQPAALYARSETEFGSLSDPSGLGLRFHVDGAGDAETLDLSIPGSPLATYRKAGPVPKTPLYLNQFTGRYYSPELDVIWEIVADGERIAVKRRKFALSRMQALFADGFASGSYRMVFTRDFDGRVDALRITTGRVHNLKFERLDD